MPTMFREDFFQRIVDVRWAEEKKVYWMAGDLQSATGSYGSYYYVSDDGIHWSGFQGGNGRFGNLYGFASGLWMRTGFKPEGAPLWILGGEGVTPDGSKRKSGIQISTNAMSLGEARFFDNGTFLGHFVGQFFADDVDGQGGGTARLESTNWDHADTFTSSDGVSWSPQQAHADRASRGIIDPKADAAAIMARNLLMNPTSADHLNIPDLNWPLSVPVLGAPLRLRSLRAEIGTRLVTPESLQANDLYQLSNRRSATGTLRKGKHAGKRVTITGGTPHDFHGPGTAAYTYFSPNCTMTDTATGKSLGKSNCQVRHGHSIAYGYYVFVVAGDDGGMSCLSYTEDGKNWHKQAFNKGHQMWSLVVGPRSDLPRPQPTAPSFVPPAPSTDPPEPVDPPEPATE
jgi:hypothetical protein